MRSKKILFCSHCVLNQNTVVTPLHRARGAFPETVKVLLEEGIGLVQLPCPEFLALGDARAPMDWAAYNSLAGYRPFCRTLAESYADLAKTYDDSSLELLGILGIQASPTCSLFGTRGVFMEEFIESLKRRRLEPKGLEIPIDHEEGRECEAFLSALRRGAFQKL
ncbi:hypothetical protein ABB02_01144 [Clostridiaceae bacterium JG1575]|nr:hypothetical protein ABB02_01144 [Clostridiaceae bacterium JG1575]